jgi:plasmid stabilization system protein ParE
LADASQHLSAPVSSLVESPRTRENVPDAVHRTLKARAATARQSLSDYLLAEMRRLAALPTRDEMLDRLHRRRRLTLKTRAAVVIREERDSA